MLHKKMWGDWTYDEPRMTLAMPGCSVDLVTIAAHEEALAWLMGLAVSPSFTANDVRSAVRALADLRGPLMRARILARKRPVEEQVLRAVASSDLRSKNQIFGVVGGARNRCFDAVDDLIVSGRIERDSRGVFVVTKLLPTPQDEIH